VLPINFITQTAHFEGETIARGSQMRDYYVGLINSQFLVAGMHFGAA